MKLADRGFSYYKYYEYAQRFKGKHELDEENKYMK